jgi:acyl carrier protein
MKREQILNELDELLKHQEIHDLRRVFAEKGYAASIRDHLCLDSLGQIELLFEIEDRHNMRITEAEAKGITTLEDLCKLMERLG